MSDYPMLISNKLHSFRNFIMQSYSFFTNINDDSSNFFLINYEFSQFRRKTICGTVVRFSSIPSLRL